MTRHTYTLAGWSGEDEDGDGYYGEYSADSGDYWQLPSSHHFGLALVRTDHPYRTTTCRTVIGQRLLKSDATVADLWRLGI